MAEVSVSERRIHPIQDAAALGNWKQALQLCDKWSKKGEKSDQFLVCQMPESSTLLELTRCIAGPQSYSSSEATRQIPTRAWKAGSHSTLQQGSGDYEYRCYRKDTRCSQKLIPPQARGSEAVGTGYSKEPSEQRASHDVAT